MNAFIKKCRDDIKRMKARAKTDAAAHRARMAELKEIGKELDAALEAELDPDQDKADAAAKRARALIDKLGKVALR
jgi:hypothetical protein